jgi:hypothetical protein
VTLAGVVVDEPDVRDTYQNLRLRAEALTMESVRAGLRPAPTREGRRPHREGRRKTCPYRFRPGTTGVGHYAEQGVLGCARMSWGRWNSLLMGRGCGYRRRSKGSSRVRFRLNS